MKQTGEMKKIIILFPFLLFPFSNYGIGHAQVKDIKINVSPDHSDWTYQTGQPVVFEVSITNSDDLSSSYSVYYEIGPEKMPPIKTGTLSTSEQNFMIEGGTMKIPGFLRCSVTITFQGRKYNEIATAAFEPEKIKPSVGRPADFEQFWNDIQHKVNEVPLDLRLTLVNEKSTDSYDFYQVDYQNIEYKNRSYGILTIPKKKGKFPAVIRFPGAGVRPPNGNKEMAENEVITLDLYIHPFPAIFEKSFYDQLSNSSYNDYKFWGVQDKDTYYYKRVIAGCLKAIDVIYSLPQFDGKNLAAWGSSQGGALSIITTALDNRIKMLVALCPAMCDFTGYLYGRAGGWPHFLNDENRKMYYKENVLKTLPYYDVVNFARMISVPGFYSWGFNDETTPPTSFYSAYNVIQAPKELFVIPHGKHRVYPEQVEKTYGWIMNQIRHVLK